MRFILRLNFFVRLLVAVVSIVAGSVLSAQVVVTWEAATTNGVGDSAGTPLATGSLLRLGTFLVDNATIQANAGNYSFLNANFVVFDTTTIGTGVGVDGHWSTVSPSTSTNALGLDGAQMYLWIFNSATAATATEQGVFTASLATWVFPADGSPANSASIELNEVNLIVLGGFGTGTSPATGSELFNLAAIPTGIPEPATTALLSGFAALSLAWVYRRIRQSERQV